MSCLCPSVQLVRPETKRSAGTKISAHRFCFAEFLNKVWQKQEPTVGLTRMIQRFNVLSSYFVYEIVHHEKLAVRQSALKRVIRIAQVCCPGN
jgi:hypothetical protein